MAVYNYDEIYKQYLNNYKKTAEEQNAAEQAAAEKAKADNAAIYEKINQQLQKKAEDSKNKIKIDYNEIYDSNAVNQYVREAKLAESMANAGLTNSGLNATQMTAIQTSRGNADSRARVAEQAAIDAIEQQLADGIAGNEQKLAEYNSSVDEKIAQNKAQRIASAENSAAEDAASYYNKLLEHEQTAQTERKNNISAASGALKNYAENASDYNVIQRIRHYANQYEMTDTEIITMCNNVGIDYDDYTKEFGKVGSQRYAKWHGEIANGNFSKTDSNNYLFLYDLWNDADIDNKRYMIDDLVTSGVFSQYEGDQAKLYMSVISSEKVKTNPELILNTLKTANDTGSLNDAPLAFLLAMGGIGIGS